MTRIKIRHYRVKRKTRRGFWEPTAAMKRLGFYAVPCGVDGPDAWTIAEAWNRRWDQTRRGEAPSPAMVSAENLSPDQAEELTVYPPRSLGEAFRRYRRTDEWSTKKPRTREDWWRCWRRIKPVFGDCDPRTVTLEDISAFRRMVEDTVSLREAHRCIKIWRALWKVSAALGYCVRDADPSLGVRNRAAPGRSATWAEGEIARVAKRAWRTGYYGLAAVIAVAWDTQMSPGDVRNLRASQLARGAAGEAFFTERGKTGKPVGGVLSIRAIAVLTAYLERLGVELHGDAYIFRNRSGAPYSSDTLGDDFRDVRIIEFGINERRTIGHDFRRSGAVEAIVGGAGAEALSHAMGNTLSSSNALFATYVPVNVATLRSVTEARRTGRTKLR
ncbi:MAG: tyrosine-type recombinase/integrase [Rhodoplanes sp.]|uniref:tyrosine-type recombinase/integrase n=1 Tax=Rhodoplanes sp. TaxID=1968906 RepID=UPI0017E0D207|nr:tyrosine-type recombinase/integrase [Rhodoplanes sp.]NVO13514.1 tyrosine-type recombinase/integrase [Rhodoplanes sp.]